MDFGVHLPLADLGQGLLGGGDLRVYTATAAGLGFDMVSANDHLVWRRPWLDGLMSLASVAGSAGDMTLATSVALPAVRHPVVLAKAITSLAVLSESPVVAGLGPGSSAADYEAVGLPFGSAGRASTKACGWSARWCAGSRPRRGGTTRSENYDWIRCRPRRLRCGSEAGGRTSDSGSMAEVRRRLAGVRVQHDA